MFVNGIADSFLLIIVLAAIGLATLIALALSAILRVFGVPWGRGIWLSLGGCFAAFTVLGALAMFNSRSREAAMPMPVEIPLPAPLLSDKPGN